jgi:hypothetical protein
LRRASSTRSCSTSRRACSGDPARGIVDFGAGLERLEDRVPLAIRSFERLGDDWRVIARVAATG